MRTDHLLPKYTETEIAAFLDENPYMDALVELLKQTIELLWITAGINFCDENEEPKEITKDQAVIAGNLVRLIKLNTSFLQNICEDKVEICFILTRCIAETYINLTYLLKNNEERVIRNYIKHSLITEKELWNTIKQNITKRNGDVHEIENRMQMSIKNSFDSSDFELDDVSRSSKWKSIAARAETLANEEFYGIYYGIASHSVHGNWQDILYNNLTKSNDSFKLDFNWHKARPQIMDGPIILNLEVVALINEVFIDNSMFASEIVTKTEDFFKYHSQILENHENYLLKKKR